MTADRTATTPLAPLEANALRWCCDPAQFEFQTTAELPDLESILGQPRAAEAVQFGIRIPGEGFNIFALGPSGTGKQSVVRQFLTQKAASDPAADDWCYVNNFDEPYKPRALKLPAGWGAKLRQAMEALVDDLRNTIPATLESDEHREQLEQIEQEFKEQHEQAFSAVVEKAKARGIELVRTPGGFTLAPTVDGEVMSPEDYEKLSAEEKQRIERDVSDLQNDVQNVLEQVPQLKKQARDRVKELNREVVRFATDHLLEGVKKQFAQLPQVTEYLEAVEHDVIQHADDFTAQREQPAVLLGIAPPERPTFQNYRVNVLVDNAEQAGAPIVYEEHPNYQNLLGRVEHRSQMGTLVTDFTLIKPGALHRANGGYLVVDARKVLAQPYAWEGLKLALMSGHVKIESLAEALSLVSTVTLEPEPVPLSVKVVLLGEPMLYYLLRHYDPDFAELFKVAADFDVRIDRSQASCQQYAQLLATMARHEKLRPLAPTAVARLLEHSARVAGDAEKLSTHLRTVTDVLREADYWAGQDAAEMVDGPHVTRAIEQQIYRADRIRERIHEEIRRGTIMIDTQGAKVGQVNGLSVLSLDTFSFGQPSRITATARLGKGEVVDIEREVELGGAIHSKGVLILSSLLASRYASERPLSLSASLVFEQSYGGVDGDSASLAELCALLSSLSRIPIRQNLALTGSVNQRGEVQAIGGVNEKIEGFFDVCRARGLTGDQGVLIPTANVKHLMLRDDVVAAAREGHFGVYPVATVDDAITLLTGKPAGEPDAEGAYPADSVNGRVEARLAEFSQLRQEFSEAMKKPETPHE